VYSEQVTGEVDHGAKVVAPGVKLNSKELSAYVIAVCHNRGGSHRFVATGDGRLAIYPAAQDREAERSVPVNLVALPICLCADGDDDHVLVGYDDGTLRLFAPDGSSEILVRSSVGWIENAISDRQTGHRAYSVGKSVHVIDAHGKSLAYFAGLPSTPAGLAFSPDGANIAVARYIGVNVWNLSSGILLHELYWRGSHTAVTWSPDGRYIVTATQDRDLHCWLLPSGKDFKMSGYPSKIRSIGWTASSSYICASGADTVTSWHCDEGGPGGKPALELGYVFNGTVMHVAPHPERESVAAGYDDGTVLIGDIVNGDALIAKPAGGGPVSCIDWAPDGKSIAVGTQGGTFTVIRLT